MTLDNDLYRVTLPYACFGVHVEEGDVRVTAAISWFLFAPRTPPYREPCVRSQFATARGSNRTHVPMRNEGMRPAFACLKIVTCETAKILDNSLAVRA